MVVSQRCNVRLHFLILELRFISELHVNNMLFHKPGFAVVGKATCDVCTVGAPVLFHFIASVRKAHHVL
jgi:hypothetical protein